MLGAFASVAVDIERPPVPANRRRRPFRPPGRSSPGRLRSRSGTAAAGDRARGRPLAARSERRRGPLHLRGLRRHRYSDLPGTGQLAISADDIREGLHDLVLTVPAAIDTTKLKVGESVTATATFGDDGSLTLTGLASDERSKGADDFDATQGDLAVEEPSK